MACKTKQQMIDELSREKNYSERQLEALREAFDIIMESPEVLEGSKDRYVEKAVETDGYRKYADTMKGIVEDISSPKVSTSDELVFKLLIEKNISELVAGQYHEGTHEIKIANLDNVDAGLLAHRWVSERFFQVVDSTDIDDVADEDLASYMEAHPKFKELQKESKEVVAKAMEQLGDMRKSGSTHTVLHEYIHAGASKFMKDNPEHGATKRIHKIFELVKKDRYKTIIRNNMEDRQFNEDTYWSESVDEFLAEALSNPRLMAALREIPYSGSNVFTKLYETVMNALGWKKGGTVFDYVLDGYTVMMDTQLKARKSGYGRARGVKYGEPDIQLGSSEEAIQLGDRYPGADAAYRRTRRKYKEDVLGEYRELIGKKLMVVDDETNKAKFKKVLNASWVYNSYLEVIFDDNTSMVVDPETGADVVTFERIEDWNKSPMYRGSEESSGEAKFSEEQDLGVVGDVEKMRLLVDKLNLIDPNPSSKSMTKYYKELLGDLDPENFREMRTYLDENGDSTLGLVSNTKINLRISAFKKMAGNTMSGAETYVHELIHAYTMFALREGSRRASRAIRKIKYLRDTLAKGNDWTVFMPKESFDKVEEEANAKAMWKYVFENEKREALDEFLAHVMSNPILMAKAKDVRIKEDKVNKTLFDLIINTFQDMLDLLAGRFSFRSKNRTVYEEVARLTNVLGNINNGAVVEKNEGQKLVYKLATWFDKAEYKVSEKMQAKLAEWESKMGDIKDDPMPRQGTKWEYAKWLVRFLPRLVLNDKMKPYFEIALTNLGMGPTGFVQNMLRDFRTPSELEKIIDKAIMHSGRIDSVRESIMESTYNLINEGFKKPLDKLDSVALTEIVVETDLQSVYDKLGRIRTINILEDSSMLDKEIASTKEELEKENEKYYKFNMNQAVGLGYYMVTGNGHEAQLPNAEDIVRGTLVDMGKEYSAKELELVDKLATLTAIEHSNRGNRVRVARLLAKETVGVENVLAVHKNFTEESREQLFANSGVNVQKGYAKEIFNDSIALEVAPISDRSKMENEGYELAYPLPSNDFGENKDMGMYRSKNFNRSEYYKTATKLTNMSKKGTSVSNIAHRQNPEAGYIAAKNAIGKADKIRVKLVNEMLENELSIDKMKGSRLPLLNDNGKVVDYRYIMSKDNRKELLEQEKDVAKVLGRSKGNVYDKVHTKEHNKQILEVMFDDQKNNYIGGKLGKDDSLYVEISENSADKEGREIWKLLPNDMKQAIKESEHGHLAVRHSMLLNYFGFRHLGLANSKLGKMMPKIIQMAIKVFEEIWQAIVSIAKVDILIRIPAVIIGNIISNFVFGVMQGYSPVELFKVYVEEGRNIREYVSKHKEYTELIVARDSGNIRKLDIGKIARLKGDLEANPIHELMEAGIYESVMEDMSSEESKTNNVIGKWLKERTEGLPEGSKTAWNWFTLNDQTAWYKNMEMGLRMGDLLGQAAQNSRARMVNDKKLVKVEKQLYRDGLRGGALTSAVSKRKEAMDKQRLEDLSYDFIFYSKPASAFEEYLNRMGVFMFTKYAKRIQRIIGKTSLKHPFRTAIAMGVDEFVFDDRLDSITDQSILNRGWSNYFQDPIALLERSVPIGLRVLY